MKDINKKNIKIIKEELSDRDYKEIRDLIRLEVASILFDMYKKRKSWIRT
jgi:hypothetical protein